MLAPCNGVKRDRTPKFRKGYAVYFRPAGRIRAPKPRCKHSDRAIVQPGDYDRIRDAWIDWCSSCKSLITSEPLRQRVFEAPYYEARLDAAEGH